MARKFIYVNADGDYQETPGAYEQSDFMAVSAGVADADPGMKSKILAMGIAKAMNTTAFGLISAITLMVMHTILSNKALKINNSIDEYATKLVDLLSIKSKRIDTDA